MEQFNLGNDGVRSSRRRLSSILKAPRTSMKVPGSEQEEQQEEITKPVEKKRNSRRVSFAATQNVRLFSKDLKGESPVLASVQNTTAGDPVQDENKSVLRFADDESNQIKGLDTLLNTPLYVSQHLNMENFFSDPVSQDDFVERTMLLGENTGFMDMTHSHTIMIDKDDEDDERNPNFGLKVAQNLTENQNVPGKKGSSCDAKVNTKNPTMDADFNAFLASISLPTMKNNVRLSSNNNCGSLIGSASTNASKIDKENQLPPFLIKQVQPKPLQGLQRRRSRVAFSECDDMETTQSHTVVIENKSKDQPVLSVNNEGIAPTTAFLRADDDMELTRSQTAALNVRFTGNISNTVQSALDHNRSHYFSENDDAMEMTGMFDVSRREKEHTISMKDAALISKVSKVPSFSVSGNVEIMDQDKHFLSNTQTAISDDMEITEALDVPVKEKEHTSSMRMETVFSFPHVSKKIFNVIESREIMDHNKSGHFPVAETASSDGMEMTEALEVSIREKDHTLTIKEKPLLFSQISKKSSFNLPRNADMMDQNVPSNLPIAETCNMDDMEMTRCQTIVLEAEQFSGNKSISSSRKSFFNNMLVKETSMDKNKPSNLSIAQDPSSDDMNITEALEVSMQEKKFRVTENKKMSLLFSKTGGKSFNLTGNVEGLAQAQTGNMDDMEMTRCQTIVLETEQFGENKPFSNSRKSFFDNVFGKEDLMDKNKPVAQDPTLDHLNITEALEVSLQDKKIRTTENEKILLPFSKISGKSFNLTGNMQATAQDQTGNMDDMEMTQCQTIVLEAEQFSGNKPFSSSRRIVDKNKSGSLSIAQDVTSDDMNITEALEVSVQEKMFKITENEKMSLQFSKISGKSFNLTGNVEAQAQTADFGDMEMTQCQTVILEAKQFGGNKSRKSLPHAMVSESSVGMDLTLACAADTTNTRMETGVDRLPVSERKPFMPRRKGMVSLCNPKNIESDNYQANFSNSDDMTMTTEDNKRSKLFGISRKSLNVASSGPNVDCMPNCVDDGMEFTSCNTVAIDALADAPVKAINQYSNIPFNLNSDLDSNHSTTEKMSHGTADVQVDGNYKVACPSTVVSTEPVDEDNSMQVTKAFTMLIETQDCVKRSELSNLETLAGFGHEEKVVEGHWSDKEQSVNESDSFVNKELQHANARQRSLAEFQMELQNMSRRINQDLIKEATAPLSSCPLAENSLQRQCSVEPDLNATPNLKQRHEKTTPFSLKKKPFSSRVSFGGIVPKLPRKSTAMTPNKTVTISSHISPHPPLEKHTDVELNSNLESVDINAEEFPEMSSEDDLSGSLENWPIHKKDEQVDISVAVPNENPLEDDVFYPDVSTSQTLKRPYLEETNVAGERSKKACIPDTGPVCHEAGIQWEGNFTSHVTQNTSAKIIEDTGISESSLKYSQCESHLDGYLDYEFDFDKKLEDGSITVNEFLSHFGINFVIHRPRPSALPDTRQAGETRTVEDLLKEKYIHHPKQRVYERDCKELTDIVERLKERAPELEKPLRCINEALHQEICSLSKEQLKSFGSKLKALKVYFGKRSKAVSHETKSVLYSNLIKTTEDSKQQLVAKIKEADEMMDELDGCINDLETELAAVDAALEEDHHGSCQTTPTLKSKEDELHKLNSALSETERGIDEMHIQLTSLQSKEKKLREIYSGFKSQLATFKSLNEWCLDETDERGALFSFLHNTVHLQVKLQTPAGKEWITEDVEQNMDVDLHLQLDAEKSECHASMIHKLLAVHNHLQTQWLRNYPTTQHIPKLLHDVSLVVGNLRLLGEEIHRLKKWGGLRLCIRQIACVDTTVHVVFSSLKAFEKFELSLIVTPNYPSEPLQIQDFINHIGNTRLSQIEDVVSSVKPGMNYLTNILKSIHSTILC